MSCIPDLPATNPISQLIVSALGDNFFPPFDPNFQPVDRSKLTEEKFLQWQLPGGGKIKPIGDPKHTHLSEYLTPLSGLLGSVFAFFGPLYIILDVIRALIDILCSLFNPIPLILTFIDLFINVLPPLIALYPPLSSILHAINVAKLLVAIAGSMIAALIPIIVEIVHCAIDIPTELAQGNINIVEACEVKLCELFQEMANAMAGFGPIKFILEILQLFLELGAQFPCVPALPGIPGSPCCTSENCPPVVINPPRGTMRVLHRVEKFTLADLANFIFDLVNIPLEAISDVINTAIGAIFDKIEDIFDDVGDVFAPIEDIINLIIDNLGPVFDTLNGLTAGVFPSAEDIGLDSLDIDLPSFDLGNISLPDITIDLTLSSPEFFKDVVFVHPLTTLEYRTAVSSENENGLVSAKGVNQPFSADELADIQNFIIPPEKIPAPSAPMPEGVDDDKKGEEEPASIRVKLTNPATGESVITRALFQFPTAQQIADRMGITKSQLAGALSTIGLGFLPLNALGVIQVYDDTFPEGTELEYEVLPDQIELLKANLIGLGCLNDIAAASKAAYERFSADIDAAAAVQFGNDSEGSGRDNGISGGDSLFSKIGRGVPSVTGLEACLNELFQKIQDDPTTPVDPLPCFNDFFDDVADFADKVLCVGISSIESQFTVSKQFVLSDTKDKAVLSLRVKDSGGNDLLLGGLVPNSQFRAEFYTTHGTVGPVEFDPDTGSFIAALTSDTPGKAEVTAAFIVRDKVCSRISVFKDLEVQRQVEEVEFVPERTQFPRVRQQPQYVHSRGGRARR